MTKKCDSCFISLTYRKIRALAPIQCPHQSPSFAAVRREVYTDGSGNQTLNKAIFNLVTLTTQQQKPLNRLEANFSWPHLHRSAPSPLPPPAHPPIDCKRFRTNQFEQRHLHQTQEMRPLSICSTKSRFDNVHMHAYVAPFDVLGGLSSIHPSPVAEDG